MATSKQNGTNRARNLQENNLLKSIAVDKDKISFVASYLVCDVISFRIKKEGDHVALLSAFAEMRVMLRMDLPEQAMEETLKNFSEQREKKLKALQEKMKLDDKEVKRFNPVDAMLEIL